MLWLPFISGSGFGQYCIVSSHDFSREFAYVFFEEIEFGSEQLLCKKTVFQRTNAQYSKLT